MITSEKLLKLLNEQIKNEFDSSQAYLAMSGWFESTPYKGFAARFRASALEEHGHGMQFFDYICDRDGKIEVLELAKPKQEYKSVLEATKSALAEERKVTGQIRRMYEVAEEEGDYETKEFLNGFLKEQIHEEKESKDLVEYVELAGNDVAALIALDKASAPAGK